MDVLLQDELFEMDRLVRQEKREMEEEIRKYRRELQRLGYSPAEIRELVRRVRCHEPIEVPISTVFVFSLTGCIPPHLSENDNGTIRFLSLLYQSSFDVAVRRGLGSF